MYLGLILLQATRTHIHDSRHCITVDEIYSQGYSHPVGKKKASYHTAAPAPMKK